MKPAALAIFVALVPVLSLARSPSHPGNDPAFLTLPNGKSLASVRVNGYPLSLTRGTGRPFGAREQAAYKKLRAEADAGRVHVDYVLMDLDRRQVLAQSPKTSRLQFGASVSKVFVGATLLDKQKGELRAGQLGLLAGMIVVSSNTAWAQLQAQIGGGDFHAGKEPNFRFTQRMGYARTRGWSGNWRGLHGNELSAKELADFLADTYHSRYPGAETLWKVMHTGRTGALRGKKYLPSDLYVGGKTGTYDGPTPMSEGPRNVRVRHHILAFNVKGVEYGLVVLANTGSEETSALLAGGLLREYTGYGR